MYNLLIVDDEPVILKSLCEMVQENREEAFTVYAAPSAAQALDIMEDVWIDLIMSDIRMPDMDGLQLLRQVEQKWPHCRVVFLTGHSEFEYARQAVSPLVLSYVLKLEGDKKILEALDRAQAVIHAEFLQKSRQMALESDLRLAKPLMRAECLRQMIATRRWDNLDDFEARLRSAGISLDLKQPLLMAAILMQPDWPAIQRTQAQETVEKLIAEYYKAASAVVLPDVLLMVAQARDGDSHPNYLLGLMEKASVHCGHAGNGVPRVLVYGEAFPLSEAFRAYSLLNHRRFAWMEAEGVQLCMPENVNAGLREAPVMGSFRVEALSNALMHASESDYHSLLEALAGDLADASPLDLATAYTTLASLLLQAIANHLPREHDLARKLPLGEIANYQAHGSFQEAIRFLNRVAGDYFQARRQVTTDMRSYVIHVVNRFIADHLHEGLGLTQLSGQVHLHPAYLSRIYREATGISINQCIVNQRIRLAKMLLADPLIKMSEIVARTGLNTPSYFTYYFKKHVGATPQEYRTLALKGKLS